MNNGTIDYITDLLAMIVDFRLAMEHIGNKEPNIELLKKRILEEEDVTLAEALAHADYEIQSQKEQQESIIKRREEYAKIDHLLFEAVAESYEGRPEKMDTYMELRQEIKEKWPL